MTDIRVPGVGTPSKALLGSDFPLPLDRPFTSDQAAAAGVSRNQLHRLVSDGYLRRLLRGVYAASQMPDSVRTRTAAIASVAPPDAVATDRVAAWLHGVSILPRTAREQPPPIEMFLRHDNHLRRLGISSGRRGLLDTDVMEIDGVLVTTPLRTALDLGRLLWRFDALAALDGFLRIGVDHDELLDEIRRFKGYRGVRQLRPLALIADGRAESPGESALRLHWYDAGLPTPSLQHWVLGDHGEQLFRLDLSLPELRYAGEYDGMEFHSEPEDIEHDDARRRWLEEVRHWAVDVFARKDVYGLRPDAPSRLRAGVNKARRHVALWRP